MIEALIMQQRLSNAKKTQTNMLMAIAEGLNIDTIMLCVGIGHT
jgi:hypothetical protein